MERGARKREKSGGVIRRLARQTQEQPGSTSRNLIIAAKYHEAQSLAWPPSVIRSGPRGKYDYVSRVKRESRRRLGMDVVRAGVSAPIRGDMKPSGHRREADHMNLFTLIACPPLFHSCIIFLPEDGQTFPLEYLSLAVCH